MAAAKLFDTKFYGLPIFVVPVGTACGLPPITCVRNRLARRNAKLKKIPPSTLSGRIFFIPYLFFRRFFATHHLLFSKCAAAGGAGFDGLAIHREELEVWFLAARYFDIGMTDVIGANSGFTAQGAGSAHIERLGIIGYTSS